MANTTRKKTVNESVENYSTDTFNEQESVDSSKKEFNSKYWNLIEFSDFNTYVMNVKNGIVIKTESENGSSMCFVQNIKFQDGKFEKIV